MGGGEEEGRRGTKKKTTPPPGTLFILQKKRIVSGIYAGQSAEDNMRRALFRNDKIYEKSDLIHISPN